MAKVVLWREYPLRLRSGQRCEGVLGMRTQRAKKFSLKPGKTCSVVTSTLATIFSRHC
jgi:hypothetical protein